MLPNMWSSSFLLSLCFLLGLSISLLSNKVFLVWLGLELNMFGIIPFINSKPNQTKNTLFLSSEEMKVSFFYFFIQVIGSLLLAWGSVLGSWFIVSIMGLMMKMGSAPFFWWVPPMVSRLDWFSMGVVSTIQKIPGMFLFRLMFDLELSVCVLLSVVGFGVSVMGIKFSSKNLKQLIGWSSVSNMSILFILIMLKSKLGLIYYCFYSGLVLMFCLMLNSYSMSSVSSSFVKGKKSVYSILVGSLLLVFSGLPPLISFLLKIYFLGGFYLFDCMKMLLDIEFNGTSMSFFHLLANALDSWSMVIFFILLMIFQAVGYIKVFIKIFTSKSSRASSTSKLLKSKMGSFLKWVVFLYLLSLLPILVV